MSVPSTPPPPPSSINHRRSGYCPSTGIFTSLRPNLPLPDPFPTSAAAYALSFIPSPAPLPLAAYIDAATGESIPFSSLPNLVSSLASSLRRSLDISDGLVALILSPTRLEIPILYLSLISAGAVVCPINPSLSPAEISRVAAVAGANLAFATSDAAGKLPRGIRSVQIDSPAFDSMLRRPPIGVDRLPIRRSSDPAAIVFSSGTTGAMKGVVLTHGNLVAQLAPFRQIPRWRPAAQTMTAPLFHVYGMVFSLKGAVTGETTVLQTAARFDAGRLVGAIRRFAVTQVVLSPTALLAMVRLFEGGGARPCDVDSLESITCGAAALPVGLIRRFSAIFPGVALLQGYGLTESTSGVLRTISLEESVRIGSAGRLVPNCEAKIVDQDTSAPLPPGKPGELWLRGPSIMKGYVGDPEATKTALDEEGWLRTGDLCFFDNDGFAYIVGRLKELIKYKGYQVPPAELENLLQDHPEIAEAAVIPCPDEEAGEVPMAFVVRHPGSSVDEAGVMDFVNKQVAPYKKIRRVSFIDSVPKNAAGKILRKDLVKLLLASSDSARPKL